MTNKRLSSTVLVLVTIMVFVGSNFTISNTSPVLVYATSPLNQSIQQDQLDLQSTINKEVQQTITETVDSINTIDNSNVTLSMTTINNNTQSSILPSSPSSLFEDMIREIDSLPVQKVTVDDIDMAYKQIDEGNNTIVLIAGAGDTIDM
ncbi:hypothetical protein [Candidatus Nitrosocosmicus franklandus]|uniref:Uncharacterized protein n=1 Tax=Candidatus Nitrosocosmicus franklandianus TaxID=1798806 RepID=A0A484ICV1_9ARCH|nr:hypothetical protein [Candidatus Nitrosocosmicus franklandus]VFJ15176.1 exported protein of unknown function [Candidatus Nitrosocosmicus franklandus]